MSSKKISFLNLILENKKPGQMTGLNAWISYYGLSFYFPGIIIYAKRLLVYFPLLPPPPVVNLVMLVVN